MNRIRLLAAGTMIILAGCSSNPGLIADPIKVSGKVVSSDGRPIKDVMLHLQPMERGFGAITKLSAEGGFSAELVPGKYMYFFATPEGGRGPEKQKAETALKAIPEKYRSADLATYVTVRNESLEIKLN